MILHDINLRQTWGKSLQELCLLQLSVTSDYFKIKKVLRISEV